MSGMDIEFLQCLQLKIFCVLLYLGALEIWVFAFIKSNRTKIQNQVFNFEEFVFMRGSFNVDVKSSNYVPSNGTVIDYKLERVCEEAVVA
jgi:hypothetical protein